MKAGRRASGHWGDGGEDKGGSGHLKPPLICEKGTHEDVSLTLTVHANITMRGDIRLRQGSKLTVQRAFLLCKYKYDENSSLASPPGCCIFREPHPEENLVQM